MFMCVTIKKLNSEVVDIFINWNKSKVNLNDKNKPADALVIDVIQVSADMGLT